MQMRTNVQSLNQISDKQFRNSPIESFLKEIDKCCGVMDEMMVANLHPNREKTENVKLFKRKHGFEKFRKELRVKIDNYFEGIIKEKEDIAEKFKEELDRERLKYKDVRN